MCKKIIIAIFTVIFITNIFTGYISKSYAGSISDIFTGAKDFMDKGEELTDTQEKKLKEASDSVYNILLIIGIGAAVIISGILGIKFMMGSVEEKAQVKDQLVPFIIGCIVVFGAFGIWKIVVGIFRQL